MLEVAQLEALRNSADALQAISQFLNELLKAKVEPNVAGTAPNHVVTFYLPGGGYLQLTREGLRLYSSRVTDAQRKQIEDFCKQLVLAMAEQDMVSALAEVFELRDDQPVLDEWNNPIGRVLTLRI